MPPFHPRIAIVGGGPAGLTLGILLERRSIPFTIFELRQRPTKEELAQPSGSLDLHKESGIAAVKACGLFDETMSLTGDCTEQQIIANKNGNIIYKDQGADGERGRPEIYRNDITELFIKHLPTESIKWGHKIIGANRSTVSTHSNIELDFGDKGKKNFDLVVGADGAWSRVRPLLTDVKPHYAGLHLITLHIRQVTEKKRHLADLLGSGTFTCLANKHGVLAQRAIRGSSRIYIIISTDDEHFATTSGFSGKSPAQAKRILLGENAMFSQWGDNIKELIATACDDETAYDPKATLDIRPLHTLPYGHSWAHQADATLVGDAAHLMNPPAGEGVNIAMLDALLLSEAIIKAHNTDGQNEASVRTALDVGIEDFERGMVPRVEELADQTREISGLMFGGEDGSGDMARWFHQIFAAHA